MKRLTRLRFSLRVLLVLLTLCAVGFAYAGWRIRHRQAKLQLIAELEAQHILLTGDDGGSMFAEPQITECSIGGPIPTRYANLAFLDRFPELETFTAGEITIDRNGFRRLFRHSNLRSISLFRANLVNPCWPEADNTELVHLGLEFCPCLGGVEAFLSTCSRLETLNLQFTDLRSEQLTFLADCPQLKSIDVSYTQIDHRSAAYWRHPRLAHVNLAETQIDDRVVAALAGCSHLESLTMSGCPLSDCSSIHLGRVKDLDVSCCFLSDHWIELFPQANRLHTLWADGNEFALWRPKHARKFPHLAEEVYAAFAVIDIRTLEALPNELFPQIDGTLTTPQEIQDWISRTRAMKRQRAADATSEGRFDNSRFLVFVELNRLRSPPEHTLVQSFLDTTPPNSEQAPTGALPDHHER